MSKQKTTSFILYSFSLLASTWLIFLTIKMRTSHLGWWDRVLVRSGPCMYEPKRAHREISFRFLKAKYTTLLLQNYLKLGEKKTLISEIHITILQKKNCAKIEYQFVYFFKCSHLWIKEEILRLQVLSILTAKMNTRFKTFFYWQTIQTKCFNCPLKWSNHCLSLYRLFTWTLNDKD